VRVLAATGALAVCAAALAGSAHAHGLSPRVASELRTARAPLGQLQQLSERRSLGTTFVRVRQEVNGIPVLGASATLALGADGNRLLLDHTRPTVGRPAAASVSRTSAVQKARAASGAHSLRAPMRAGLALLPGRPDRLVWRVVIPSARPLGDFEVLVDARSGAPVRVRNLIQRASAKALVFDPNPIVEQGSRTGLVDNNNADSTALTALYRPVTLQDLDPAGCLTGLWVNAVLSRFAFCPASFSSVTRANACNCFDAVMAYFHIDRMQRYLQSFGFSNIVHRAIPVNLHATTADNSFYSPSTGSLNFGDGGVNDAQDADVISHEYGHAIQDSQVPGFGETTEGGTLGEGFGDYWQAAMSANGGNADTFNTCFAEWDTSAISTDPLPCLRRVDLPWTLDQAVRECGGREIHCVGQAWSNTLWTIRQRLGGPAADRLILQSQFNYVSASGFRDASLALLFADQELNGGANQDFLRGLLMSRGFLLADSLDDEPSGATALAFPGQASGSAGITTDDRDVFAVPLTAGTAVVFHLRGSANVFFALTLYPPGTRTIESGTSVAHTSASATSPSLAYVPTAGGTYYLSIAADSGDGTYMIETLRDLDRDGVADAADDCPSVADPSQGDWNRNGKGDACDRASKTTISRITVRGHTLTVTGALLPPSASPASWFVEVRKAGKLVVNTRGGRGKRTGRAVAVVKVPTRIRGRVLVRAVLKDRRFDRATSKMVGITLR
jgi:hypothetical protein